MTKTLLAIALAAVTATGCMTTQERIAVTADECASMGFTQGTAGHAHCIYYRNAAKEQQRAAAWARMANNYAPPVQHQVYVTPY